MTPELTVDLNAVAQNVRHFSRITTGQVMAVVKADGFGHGASDVAATALSAGATKLGVTSLAEAHALRDAGIDAPILSWLNPVDADFAAAQVCDIDVAIPGVEHLRAAASATRSGRPLRVHLQMDVGMARDGSTPLDWPHLCRFARALQDAGRVDVIGVMGHLPCAEQPSDPSNATGRRRFAKAVRIARAFGLHLRDRHLAATHATLNDPLTHHTMSRIGAGLVGIGSPLLRPALTLKAPLIFCREVSAGTSVGYGHAWTAPRSTHLGLIPLGYADGIPRNAPCAEVSVNGRRYPVVGRISMDQTVIDLGTSPVPLGEEAIVFGGNGPTVSEWASWASTIEHEIITGIGPRVQRVILAAQRELQVAS